MALYAFDGTWNSAKETEEDQAENTNVVRFFRAYDAHSTPATNFYVAGVGTRFDLIGHVFGGAFGLGELSRLNEAYQHLCQRWSDDDRIIDIVGFSRGAATSLDFCNLVQARGIRQPDTDDVVEATPLIRFLGVWDVVGAFNLAALGLPDLNIGHHLSLPKANLRYAFHALALDERRPSFAPTRLLGAWEVWFRGVHSDIGGGNGNLGLNDVTLTWMMRKAKAAGLPIEDGDIAALNPDPTAPPQPAMDLPLDIRVVGALDRRSYTVSDEPPWRMPPATCPIETLGDESTAVAVGERVTVLSPDEIRRISTLVGAAETTANQLAFPLVGVREAMFTLIETRIPLVRNDADLLRARNSTVRLVRSMVEGAQRAHFHTLNEFFLTEALFNLRPIYPFTD